MGNDSLQKYPMAFLKVGFICLFSLMIITIHPTFFAKLLNPRYPVISRILGIWLKYGDCMDGVCQASLLTNKKGWF